MLIKFNLATKLRELPISLGSFDYCYDPFAKNSEQYISWFDNYKEMSQQERDRIVPTYPQSRLQTFLRNKRILVEVVPVDSWDSWTYSVYLEDAMSPFFKATSSEYFLEFLTYEDALEAGLTCAIDFL